MLTTVRQLLKLPMVITLLQAVIEESHFTAASIYFRKIFQAQIWMLFFIQVPNLWDIQASDPPTSQPRWAGCRKKQPTPARMCHISMWILPLPLAPWAVCTRAPGAPGATCFLLISLTAHAMLAGWGSHSVAFLSVDQCKPRLGKEHAVNRIQNQCVQSPLKWLCHLEVVSFFQSFLFRDCLDAPVLTWHFQMRSLDHNATVVDVLHLVRWKNL